MSKYSPIHPREESFIGCRHDIRSSARRYISKISIFYLRRMRAFIMYDLRVSGRASERASESACVHIRVRSVRARKGAI